VTCGALSRGLLLISGATELRQPPIWRGSGHISFLPVLVAVFLKGFLCHSLHKFRIVPGDVFWDHHSDGVGIEELHNHLSDPSGNAGVRSLGPHRRDLEIEWVFTLSEISQLGHPTKLLIQLLQQGGRVEHLLLIGLQELVVQPGELLGNLEGIIKFLSQLSLSGVAGRTVCPEMGKKQGRNVKGRLKNDKNMNGNQFMEPGPKAEIL